MPFPDSPRVIYKKNPLEQVICQLRFPPILRIDTEPPAKYQDAIRKEYPLFEERKGISLDLPNQLQEQLPPEFLRLLGSSDKKAYNFISIDKQWTISFTRDFIALTTGRYTRWEEFKEYFKIPFETLLNEYSPALFSRVGLRYRNIIRKSELGLQDISWSELIQPYIAGPLSDSSELDNDCIVAMNSTVDIRLINNYGKVKIRHGFVEDKTTNEICYQIDSDFSTENIEEHDNAIERLHHFNRRAGRLFRWCITPKLHTAMEPEKI